MEGKREGKRRIYSMHNSSDALLYHWLCSLCSNVVLLWLWCVCVSKSICEYGLIIYRPAMVAYVSNHLQQKNNGFIKQIYGSVRVVLIAFRRSTGIIGQTDRQTLIKCVSTALLIGRNEPFVRRPTLPVIVTTWSTKKTSNDDHCDGNYDSNEHSRYSR